MAWSHPLYEEASEGTGCPRQRLTLTRASSGERKRAFSLPVVLIAMANDREPLAGDEESTIGFALAEPSRSDESDEDRNDPGAAQPSPSSSDSPADTLATLPRLNASVPPSYRSSPLAAPPLISYSDRPSLDLEELADDNTHARSASETRRSSLSTLLDPVLKLKDAVTRDRSKVSVLPRPRPFFCPRGRSALGPFCAPIACMHLPLFQVSRGGNQAAALGQGRV